jgi:hypothetical protein
MPKFHFPIVDGTRLEDPVGANLAGDKEAAKHAEDIARHVSNLGHKKQRHVLAIDEAGTEVHKADVQNND